VRLAVRAVAAVVTTLVILTLEVLAIHHLQVQAKVIAVQMALMPLPTLAVVAAVLVRGVVALMVVMVQHHQLLELL